MPRVSLYIDQELYTRIRSRAEEKGVTLSRYVRDSLKDQISNEWPVGYFDLFGSIDDDSFKVPDELPWPPYAETNL